MESINFSLVFDLLITVFGAYLLICALKMKKTGEPSSMILQEDEKHRLKHKKEFVKELEMKLLLFGAVTFLYGCIGCINILTINNMWIGILGLGFFLLVCFWFVTELHNVRNRFLK